MKKTGQDKWLFSAVVMLVLATICAIGLMVSVSKTAKNTEMPQAYPLRQPQKVEITSLPPSTAATPEPQPAPLPPPPPLTLS